MSALEVAGLCVTFGTRAGDVRAVRDLAFTLEPGRTLGIVGESGAGKSTAALAVGGLLPRYARVTGSVRCLGRELLGLPERDLAAVRGGTIGYIPQSGSLNPAFPVGWQVAEPLRVRQGMTRDAARSRAAELLEAVGLPAGQARRYPHELSGGMRQRVVIATAMALSPAVLIADEPTAGLDVTTAAQVLEVLRTAAAGAALILITHDLGVVARLADDVTVMYAGQAVEAGPAEQVFYRASSPYTRGLLGSLFRLDSAQARPPRTARASAEPILSVTGLVKDYPIRGGGPLRRQAGRAHAVGGVSLELRAAETLGLVGESGAGKSTTARTILQLVRPTAGSVRFEGQELTTRSRRQLRPLRQHLQVVFQDPLASLDPRMPAGEIVAEPLRVHGRWDRYAGPGRVEELFRLVGLAAEHRDRYPHEFSGGQRQRIGIARALALEPKVLILDEPVSALDVSIQAGVVNLLADLRDRLGLAYLFISHDLAVVRHLCDRVAVMYLGKIVESGTSGQVYGRPSHPYTQALLSAVPVPDPAVERRRRRILLAGEAPSAAAPPSGCRFRTRCWKAAPVCAEQEPALADRGQGHPVACHFPATAGTWSP